jgi:hypothetical protein
MLINYICKYTKIKWFFLKKNLKNEYFREEINRENDGRNGRDRSLLWCNKNYKLYVNPTMIRGPCEG